MFVEKLELKKDSMLNKVAIITGSGRGIGKELARALTWLGAKVIIAEISDNGKNVEQLILKEGGDALFVKTDISNENDVKNLEKIVLEKYGRVDVLINNAIVYAAGSIMELSMDDWDNAYAVNIRGAIFAIKTFLPHIMKQEEGVIMNVTSADGTPYMAPYFASKAALTSIAESLAAELDETNISVCTFAPGMVDTPGIQEATVLLAPRFGMTREQFQNQGVNPGYDGLMPADHCAAGWAYVIVHAKDYHGQIADPFTPLLKYGLIKQNRDGSEEKWQSLSSEERDSILEDTKESVDSLKEILIAVKKETDELAFFAKKWMNKTFAKRCGLTIEKFIKSIEELALDLKSPNLNLDWHVNCLKKLADHFQQCIKDARGWIKDPKELKLAINTLEFRENSVLSSIKNLELISSAS